MQKKAFAFYLLAFSFFLLSAFCFSCHTNPNMQGPGEGYLQGEWQQDSVPMQSKLITYSLYHVRFDCDSFFMAVKTFSKVNYGADTCMGKGQWVEYTRGHYVQRNDTVFLRGEYCNPDYSMKVVPGCFHIGVYEEFFKVSKKTDSLIQFSSTTGIIPINARLIKRTTCHIKPL